MQNVKDYINLQLFNGAVSGDYDLEQTEDEYTTICYNVSMVKYLFEKIYESEFETIISENSSGEYDSLEELKNYIDDVVRKCMAAEDSIYTFGTNYEEVSKEIKSFCSVNLEVIIQLKTI